MKEEFMLKVNIEIKDPNASLCVFKLYCWKALVTFSHVECLWKSKSAWEFGLFINTFINIAYVNIFV